MLSVPLTILLELYFTLNLFAVFSCPVVYTLAFATGQLY